MSGGASRAEEIKRAFVELHGGSIKQSLHDAAVELLVTQRQGVKPDVRGGFCHAEGRGVVGLQSKTARPGEESSTSDRSKHLIDA